MFTIRVTLDDVRKPPVWRQIRVPDDVTLAELHRIIQRAMGWQNCHLHKFFANEVADPVDGSDVHDDVVDDDDDELAEVEDKLAEIEFDDEGDNEDEKKTLALPLLLAGAKSRAAGPKCRAKEHLFYEYDMGDSWLHVITLEEERPEKVPPPPPTAGAQQRLVALVKAKGACPPEDIGGSFGFEDFKEVMADPDHEEHAEQAEWLMEMTGCDEFDAHDAPRPESWLI